MNTISDNIKYIGTDDLDIDLFESQYVVPEGMSYNSYLILDDKVAIMDTVDKRKAKEWFKNLSEALNGRKPDYLVVHHMEPDHAALISETLNKYPELQIVLSAAAHKMLAQFYPTEDFTQNTIIVKEGDILTLGSHNLNFIAAPMVHWPEVLMSYENSKKILFSADGFGKFGALANETDDWACEARRYYFNICGKYGAQVQNVLKKASSLDIKTICPLHGPILTGDLTPYFNLYNTWSKYEPETEGILIAYASIHGNTEKAAKQLAEMLKQEGTSKVVVSDLTRSDMAEVIEDAFRYPRMILCASSYDGGVFPVMHDFLHHLLIKNYQKRRVGILENGSWAPSAAKTMIHLLTNMKDVEVVSPIVTIRSTMKQSDLPNMKLLAESIME